MPSASDDAAALATLLEPWWRAFPDGCLDIHTEDDALVMRPRLRSLRLELFSQREERAMRWQDYCEAVEILLLASMVEPIAFRDMLKTECERLEEEEGECFDHDTVLPLRLFVQLSTDSASSMQALKTLFGTTDMRSAAYKRTRSKLV